MDLTTSLVWLVPPLLLGSSWLGWRIQRALPHSRQRDSIEAVRLVMTMLVTFAALVLGLLTSNAKARFDALDAASSRYSIELIELDQAMRNYGAEMAPARAQLRTYTAAAIAATWPNEAPPAGDYLRQLPAGFTESRVLGAMLLRIGGDIDRLQPSGATQQRVAVRLEESMASLVEQRWQLVQSIRPVISWPFMSVMIFWLVLVFAIFGLSSPANPVVLVTIGLCAVSVTVALALILDLDGPFTGWIQISSEALRDALSHLDAP